MKKLLLVAAAIVTGANMNAQEFKFGPKAGYSLSTLKFKDNKDVDNTDPMHTFFVGGVAEYKLNDNFGLQGEVLYSPLGGKINEKAEDPNDMSTYIKVRNKTTFGTVLIPVSAKYFISENFSVSAGASFGLILSAKSKTVADVSFGLVPGFELSGSDESDIKDQVNTLNIAPFLGVEYAFENGLFIDARYNYGVSNLAKDSGDGKLTNSFLQVGVGFKFGGN